MLERVGNVDTERTYVEKTGKVKWFNESKGYGFVVPDDGSPEVLVHMSVLRQCRIGALRTAATVRLEAAKWDKGWNCTRVLWVDNSTAVPLPRPENDFMLATVGVWRRGDGHGYINIGKPRGIYIGIKTVRRCGLQRLYVGQKVWVRCGEDHKGRPEVTDIKLD